MSIVDCTKEEALLVANKIFEVSVDVDCAYYLLEEITSLFDEIYVSNSNKQREVLSSLLYALSCKLTDVKYEIDLFVCGDSPIIRERFNDSLDRIKIVGYKGN